MVPPSAKPTRRGRPKKPPGERLSETVHTNLTPADVDALCMIASRLRMEPRVLLRTWIREKLRASLAAQTELIIRKIHNVGPPCVGCVVILTRVNW